MHNAPNLDPMTTVPMTSQQSRATAFVLWLGGLLLPALPAQSLAEQLAKGDARAIAAAAAALDAPSAEDVDPLIRVLAAVARPAAPLPEFVRCVAAVSDACILIAPAARRQRVALRRAACTLRGPCNCAPTSNPRSPPCARPIDRATARCPW